MDYSSLSAEELFRLCTDGDNAAWEEFICRFNPLIYTVVSRSLRRWRITDPDVIKDMMQAFYVKLCDGRALKTFRSRANTSAEAYLSTIAMHFVSDRLRSGRTLRQGAGKAGADIDSEKLTLDSSAEGSASSVERHVLLAEVEKQLHAVLSPKTRERDLKIFRLYFGFGFTAADIAAIPEIGLTTKGVESVIVRLTALIRERLAGGGAQG